MTNETTQADGAPLVRQVRPLRWLCQSCDWTGDDEALLRASSPFDAATVIYGCPTCKAVDDIVNACDESGCQSEATCGFPAPGGYRRTCGRHYVPAA